MEQPSQSFHTTPSFTHPLEVIDQKWILSVLSTQYRNLIVPFLNVFSQEIEAPPLTHHVLGVQINDAISRIITHIDGQEYDGISQYGDLFLLPAGKEIFSYRKDVDLQALIYILDPLFLQEVALEAECLDPSRIELLDITHEHDPQLVTISSLFFHETTNQGMNGQLYTDSLANLLAIHLLHHYCVFKPRLKQYQCGLDSNRLQIALEYIHAHLDKKLTLNSIANHLNISQYHFCILFKQSMGIPPYEYVLRQRVERAKELLGKYTEMTIAEIALMCGFAHQAHLHRHFRKFTGITPKEYRDRK